MIVVAIIMAIAVPTYLGQKQSATKTKVHQNIELIAKTVDACAADKSPNGGFTGCGDELFVYHYEPSFKLNDQLKSNFWFEEDTNQLANRYEIQGIGPGGVENSGGLANEEQIGFLVRGWMYEGSKLVQFEYRRNADGSVDRTCTVNKRNCPKGTW